MTTNYELVLKVLKSEILSNLRGEKFYDVDAQIVDGKIEISIEDSQTNRQATARWLEKWAPEGLFYDSEALEAAIAQLEEEE